MSILSIITVPHPVLKEQANPIETITEEIKQQAADMAQTMYEAPGIGLAANQVGKLNRLFVMDVAFRSDKNSRQFEVCINPEIVKASEEKSLMEEGCLSIPQQFATVERPRTIQARWLNLSGEWQEAEFSDLASHCFQHELDHLNGILFVDYLSQLKRRLIIERVKKLTKAAKGREVL